MMDFMVDQVVMMNERYGKITPWACFTQKHHDQLKPGKMYVITNIEIHGWHTRIWLKGLKLPVNSVWLRALTEEEQQKADKAFRSPKK